MNHDEKELLDFLTVDSAYDAKVIPGTEEFTFITKKTGFPQVWKMDKKGYSHQLVTTSDRVQSVFHSPDGTRMVIGMDSGGNEKQQLYLVDHAGNTVKPLVVSANHFHYCGGWSMDGRNICYSSNRRNPGAFDVFVIDVDTGETKQVYSSDKNCVPLSWVNEREIFLDVKETNIDSTIHIVNSETGVIRQLGDHRKRARYASPIMQPNSMEGYLLSDLEEDTMYISKFSLSRPSELEKLLHWDKWDIDEIALSPNGELLSFCLNENGISKLGFYHLGSKNCFLAEGLPSGVISTMNWSSIDTVLFTLKTPVEPGDIWTYNFTNNKAERLTQMGVSKSVGHLWRMPELHTFQSFDDLEIPYFLYSSDDQEGKPAVVYVHGGPEGQTKAEYNPVIQYLTHRGFTVAAPNIRGSSGYGRAYLKLDDADKRLDAVADLASLTKELIAKHDVKKGQIGIVGRSYGGFMVLASLAHYPEIWAAGVNIVGISNLKTFLQNTGEWRRYLRESEYGSLQEFSSYFDEIAPMNLTHQMKAPLLVFHGRNDTRVPVSEAEQLVADLRSRKREVELIIFEDEGHQTERIENHITMHTETVKFFSNHLGKTLQKECLK